ncbi:MAG: hypothetical protein KDG52_21825, partial [Rhodocyclaceae bacterium]|nr:hypothetical protein [Rhodocyclaceae bacterium]
KTSTEAAEKPLSPKTVERRAAVRKTLSLKVPDGAPTREHHHEGAATLPVSAIDTYDRNPRSSKNPKFDEIKTGIRERGGLQDALSVVRRPGAERYMLYMGGNTRLQILKELWEETGDERFGTVRVAIEKWRGEADVLTAHLIENEARGDTTFFEKARGVAMLREALKEERGRYLSLKDLEQETRRMGMAGNASTLAEYAFAAEHLESVGGWLTREVSTALRIEYASLNRLVSIANLPPGRFEEAMALVFQNASELNPAPLGGAAHGAPAISVAQRGEVIVRRMRHAMTRLLDLPAEWLDRALAALGRRGGDDEIRALLAGEGEHRASPGGQTPSLPPESPKVVTTGPSPGPSQAKGQGDDSPLGDGIAPDDPRSRLPRAAAADPVQGPTETGDLAELVTAIEAKTTEVDAETDLARWHRVLEAFCAEHGIADLLRTCTPTQAIPAGFWLELPEEPLDLRTQDAASGSFDAIVCAFNVLAAMSGQFREATVAALPEASRWARMVRQDPFEEGGFDTLLVSHACTLTDTPNQAFGLGERYLAWMMRDRATWASFDRLAGAYQRLCDGLDADRPPGEV